MTDEKLKAMLNEQEPSMKVIRTLFHYFERRIDEKNITTSDPNKEKAIQILLTDVSTLQEEVQALKEFVVETIRLNYQIGSKINPFFKKFLGGIKKCDLCAKPISYTVGYQVSNEELIKRKSTVLGIAKAVPSKIRGLEFVASNPDYSPKFKNFYSEMLEYDNDLNILCRKCIVSVFKNDYYRELVLRRKFDPKLMTEGLTMNIITEIAKKVGIIQQ